MTDVHWIKLDTDIIENRKIKYLRKKSGNDAVLIWILLLTLAGRCNDGGAIYLTSDIPYDTEMLSDELHFNETIILNTLESLLSLGMIYYSKEGYITISDWETHQSIDKLAEIREYNRIAKQRSREKQKSNSIVNDMSMTCQMCQDTDKDIDKEIDKDTDKEINGDRRKRFTPPTLEEVKAYCFERGNKVDAQRFIDHYTANGWKVGKNPMKDWKASVRTWEHSENFGDSSPGKKGNIQDFYDSVDAWVNT